MPSIDEVAAPQTLRDNCTPKVLYVLTDGQPSMPTEDEGVIVDLRQTATMLELPENWTIITLSETLDIEEFWTEYLEFLNRWPNQALRQGMTFDDSFSYPGGYSPWLTGVACMRYAHVKVYWQMRAVWSMDRLRRLMKPERVVLDGGDPVVCQVLIDRFRQDGTDFELQAASTPGDAYSGRTSWLLRTYRYLMAFPIKRVITAVVARWFSKRAKLSAADHEKPAVVHASRFFRHFREEDGQITAVYCRKVEAAIKEIAPHVRQYYFVRNYGRFGKHKPVSWFYHTLWPALGRTDRMVPLRERFLALGTWLWHLPRQLLMLHRYASLEKTSKFHECFSFANHNVAAFYVERLRECIGKMSEFVYDVAATRKALKSLGSVSALLVAEEFYPATMPELAAAKQLGITTVGVQHGVISNAHLVYRILPSAVGRTPCPGYFAAYGEYAKEVVSKLGSYPANRVWVVGSDRFDELVRAGVDADRARDQMKLPANKKIILLAAQTFAWFPAAVRATLLACRDRPNWLLCIKTHPKPTGYSIADFQQIAQELHVDHVRYFEDSFPELLQACDVLVSASSTTILEATLINKPSVCVNFSDEPDYYPYVEDGASLPGTTVDELRESLSKLLADPDNEHLRRRRDEFLAKHIGPSIDGRSGEILARKVSGLLANDQTRRVDVS